MPGALLNRPGRFAADRHWMAWIIFITNHKASRKLRKQILDAWPSLNSTGLNCSDRETEVKTALDQWNQNYVKIEIN
jgi:hypothetical protein